MVKSVKFIFENGFSPMQIALTRHPATRWGVDGTLTIDDRRLCDTVEHPDRLLAPGTYPLRLSQDRRLARLVPQLPQGAVVRPANGPFTLRHGSIGVGDRQLRGLLTGSSDCFDRLMQRLRRCEARGEPVTLTVR